MRSSQVRLIRNWKSIEVRVGKFVSVILRGDGKVSRKVAG